jgi:hypothetical protein
LGPGARARVPSPPVVKANGINIPPKPHIYEVVMGNSYMIASLFHGGWRVGEADPGIGGGAWIAGASDRDAIRDEEGCRGAAAASTNGGPHLVAAGCTTGHAHRYGSRGTPSWEGRRSDLGAGAAVLIDFDLIARSPCDRRPVRSKAASRYACSGKRYERPNATAPSGYIRKEAHPPCAGDVVLILVAVGIVDEEGAGRGGGGGAMALRSCVVRRGMRMPR